MSDNQQNFIDEYIEEDMEKKAEWLKVNYPNYQPLFMIARGSMNYQLMVMNDDYTSDVDCELVVMPTLRDLVKGDYKLSTTLVLDDNSHIDVRDIRHFKNLLYKQNPAQLELLYSKYTYAFSEKGKELLEFFQSHAYDIENIEKQRLLFAIKAQVFHKLKNLDKVTPTQEQEVKKYGYSAKELHHLIRFYLIALEMVQNNKNFGDCLVFKEDWRNKLIFYKTQHIDVNDALSKAWGYKDKTEELVSDYIKNNKYEVNHDTIKMVDNFVYDFMEKYILNNGR